MLPKPFAGYAVPAALALLTALSTVQVLAGAAQAAQGAEPRLVNILALPGDAPDLTALRPGQSGGANVNRQGYFSDLFYDFRSGFWYGLSDRGPGGGVLSYGTRVQRFALDVNGAGRISRYRLDATIPFTNQDGTPFNGLSPLALNGSAAVLGQSFDPEGLVDGKAGQLYVSDEYGPSVYEFTSTGRFVRAFRTPENLKPRTAAGTLDYEAGAPARGRQGNRGFEGLAINASGTKLYAVMQDPLQNEGTPNGRSSRYVRIVEFDIESGEPARQFAYPLDTVAEINARIPAGSDITPYGATAQGRNIGLSSIVGVNDDEFLVLERDNRGFGVDLMVLIGDAGGNEAVVAQQKPLHKRIYRIDLRGATDVAGITLGNALPAGTTAVSKALYLDLLAAITATPNAPPVAEKWEGFAIGPLLPDGSRLLLAGTDNDYSVTQVGGATQFDVCARWSPPYQPVQVTLGATCPAGKALVPAYLVSFKGTVPGFVAPASPWGRPHSVGDPWPFW